MSHPQPLGHGGRIEGHPITGHLILSSFDGCIVQDIAKGKEIVFKCALSPPPFRFDEIHNYYSCL